MFKGIIPAGTAFEENVNIPISVVFNTNSRTKPNRTDNSLSITTKGIYNVFVSVPITAASATPITLGLYVDGTLITSVTNDITATTGIETFNLTDAIRVIDDYIGEYARLSLRVTGGTAEANENGVVIVEALR